MQKRVNFRLKSAAFSQIFLLVMATVAFSFILAETERVRADPTLYQSTKDNLFYAEDNNGQWYVYSSGSFTETSVKNSGDMTVPRSASSAITGAFNAKFGAAPVLSSAGITTTTPAKTMYSYWKVENGQANYVAIDHQVTAAEGLGKTLFRLSDYPSPQEAMSAFERANPLVTVPPAPAKTMYSYWKVENGQANYVAIDHQVTAAEGLGKTLFRLSDYPSPQEAVFAATPTATPKYGYWKVENGKATFTSLDHMATPAEGLDNTLFLMSDYPFPEDATTAASQLAASAPYSPYAPVPPYSEYNGNLYREIERDGSKSYEKYAGWGNWIPDGKPSGAGDCDAVCERTLRNEIDADTSRSDYDPPVIPGVAVQSPSAANSPLTPTNWGSLISAGQAEVMGWTVRPGAKDATPVLETDTDVPNDKIFADKATALQKLLSVAAPSGAAVADRGNFLGYTVYVGDTEATAVYANDGVPSVDVFTTKEEAIKQFGIGGATGPFKVSLATPSAASWGTRWPKKDLTVTDVNGKSYTIAKDSNIVSHDDGTVTFTDAKTGETVTIPKNQADAFFESNKEILGANTEGYSYTPPFMKTPITNAFLGNVVEGAVWALGAFTAIQSIGRMAGLENNLVNALSTAVSAGLIVGKAVYGAFGPNAGLGAGIGAGLAGAGIALLIFGVMYKKDNYKTVKFTCEPYEAPNGGANCAECGKDPIKPCSEYRCKSLGKGCELKNKGTKNELCVWKDPKDVKSATIAPRTDVLNPGFAYVGDPNIRPPALGVKIQKSGANVCLPAFTKLQFGVNTDEATQCWLDYQHTASTKEMKFAFGDSNDFSYNHTQILALPGIDALNKSVPVIKNDGTMELFVRCADANGNENVDEYKISFCVDKSPDVMIPQVQGTSVPSGSYVKYDAENLSLELYTDEPADCKWSKVSGEGYDNMPYSMNCNNEKEINAQLNYVCTGTLGGIVGRQDNTFYFKCRDRSPANNTMTTSYPLLLKGSQPLNILSAIPNGTVYGSASPVSITLGAETANGAQEGLATCYYSETGNIGDYHEMFVTNSSTHKQEGIMRPAGSYKYFLRCIDNGGNWDTKTLSFNVFVDEKAPLIKIIYKDSDGGLRVVTNEDSECKYSLTSCNYVFKEGIDLETNPNNRNVHFIPDWKANTNYYVKCMDDYGNEPTNQADCTVKVNVVQVASK